MRRVDSLGALNGGTENGNCTYHDKGASFIVRRRGRAPAGCLT